jgi:hypothetical protein
VSAFIPGNDHPFFVVQTRAMERVEPRTACRNLSHKGRRAVSEGETDYASFSICKIARFALFLPVVLSATEFSEWVLPVLSLEFLLVSVIGTTYAGVIGFFLKRVELAEQPLTTLELSALSVVSTASICAIVYCLNRREKTESDA